MYIYCVNICIDGDENLPLEAKIDEAISKSLKNTVAERVSSLTKEVEGANFGRCVKCGCWCSDCREKDFISDFSVGAVVDGRWLCDLCLPAEHSNSF